MSKHAITASLADTRNNLLSTLMQPVPSSSAQSLFYIQLIVVLPEHDEGISRGRDAIVHITENVKLTTENTCIDRTSTPRSLYKSSMIISINVSKQSRNWSSRNAATKNPSHQKYLCALLAFHKCQKYQVAFRS